MIYLDSGATSFRKPPQVAKAVSWAMKACANPGRGGYPAAETASQVVFRCREQAGKLFQCRPEQVVLTTSCTHGLNIAIRSLVSPGARVVVSGFEHNAVVRPLYALGAKVIPTGRKLFSWEDTLESFRRALDEGADAAVFTHVSNVFGYILPVEEMAKLCRERGVPFIVDAAQSAGSQQVSLEAWGAEFIAVPGHKGLLGPAGTGLLLCRDQAEPLLYGGTGSQSMLKTMPEELPERLEPGTLNVPGAAGLLAGMRCVEKMGASNISAREEQEAGRCARGLKKLGAEVFSGPHQGGTVSFRMGVDCEDVAAALAKAGIAVRAGLHCAPLAHESAGTLDTGTVRVSYGWDASSSQTEAFLKEVSKLRLGKN